MKPFALAILLFISGCAPFEPFTASDSDLPAAVSAADKIELQPGQATVTTNGKTEILPLPQAQEIDLANWLGTLAPLADSVSLDGSKIAVATAAGVVSRPVENVPREKPTVKFVRDVAAGAGRSIETGSPIPLATSIVGGLAALLSGAYAARKRKESREKEALAVANAAEAEHKQNIVEAIVLGLKEAILPADAKAVVAKSIQNKSLAAGVEYGPGGLKETVARLHANLKKGTENDPTN